MKKEDNVVSLRSASQEVTAADLDAVGETANTNVTITTPRFRRMEGECRFLSALLEAGVENWEGYNIALDIYRSEEIGGGSAS